MNLIRFVTAVLVAFVVASFTAPLVAEDRPNVIVFIADDVSWNDYGCYGSASARTPRIDELAKDGIRYTNAFLTASSCSPSRASIITGRYPHNTGKAAELHLPIDNHLPWFPERLRDAGYYTALVGKNHMTRSRTNIRDSKPKKVFDLIDNGQLKDNHGAHGKWVDTVKNRPKDKPFFFWFAAIDAHRGWDGDREWKQEYGAKHDPEKIVVPPFLVDDEQTRKDLASYQNEVTRFDYYIGKVVDTLRAENELENTLILVLADNGRPFPRAKTRLHDSGMKTAIIAHWPVGIKNKGSNCDSLLSAIDIAPTILSVAGVPAPKEFQGLDQSETFKNQTKRIRNFAFSEHNWHDYEAHGRSVRDKNGFLFIANQRTKQAWQGPADSVRSPSHQALLKLKREGQLSKAQADVFLSPRENFELYDSRSDPKQLNNLIGKAKYSQIEFSLQKVLKRWSDETLDSVPDQISEDSFDRETGESLTKKGFRHTTPGEDTRASRTNAKGPH